LHVENLGRLEAAVYGGRGADEWVIQALGFRGEPTGADDEVLRGTKIMKAIQVWITT